MKDKKINSVIIMWVIIIILLVTSLTLTYFLVISNNEDGINENLDTTGKIDENVNVDETESDSTKKNTCDYEFVKTHLDINASYISYYYTEESLEEYEIYGLEEPSFSFPDCSYLVSDLIRNETKLPNIYNVRELDDLELYQYVFLSVGKNNNIVLYTYDYKKKVLANKGIIPHSDYASVYLTPNTEGFLINIEYVPRDYCITEECMDSFISSLKKQYDDGEFGLRLYNTNTDKIINIYNYSYPK